MEQQAKLKGVCTYYWGGGGKRKGVGTMCKIENETEKVPS
jgi:hypothetical protein